MVAPGFGIGEHDAIKVLPPILDKESDPNGICGDAAAATFSAYVADHFERDCVGPLGNDPYLVTPGGAYVFASAFFGCIGRDLYFFTMIAIVGKVHSDPNLAVRHLFDAYIRDRIDGG